MTEPAAESSGRAWVRPVALVLGLGALLTVLKVTGVLDELSRDRIQELVEQAGPLGPVVFLALMVGANVAQVPAWVFVLVAVVVWGPIQAWVLSYVGCVLAALLTFSVFRTASGEATRKLMERPLVKRVFGVMHARPVLGVALLRVVFLVTPPVTVAISLTGVRPRDHFLGTVLGVIPMLTGLVVLAAVGGLAG